MGCQPGETSCNNEYCADITNDEDNCGECGRSCPTGFSCEAGECAIECSGGRTACDNSRCANLQSDDSDCGACGTICPSGFSCGGGECLIDCPANRSACDNSRCVDLQSDEGDCGACGNGCEDDEVCISGSCEVPCQGEQTCPASSCGALRAEGVTLDGTYWIQPETSDDAFEVYCDMTKDGGGWALVWKNHGGAIGASRSNADLLENEGADLILPIDDERISSKHELAYEAYKDVPGLEWIKMATFYRVSDGDLVASENVKLALPSSVSWNDLFAEPETTCLDLGDQVRVFVDGLFIGETSMLFRLNTTAFGFASDFMTEDRCDQEADNFLSLATAPLYRPGVIRNVLSYVHNSSGRDATRCHFTCWPDTPAFYDGFNWAVREPL